MDDIFGIGWLQLSMLRMEIGFIDSFQSIASLICEAERVRSNLAAAILNQGSKG